MTGLFEQSEYLIDQKLLSLRGVHIIKDSAGMELGRTERTVLSFGPKYTLFDSSGAEAGKVVMKPFAWRPTFTFLDPYESPVAVLHMKLLTFPGTEYWVENPAGQEILRAKGNFLQNEYQIWDIAGNPVAEITMKLLAIRDNYRVTIVQPAANRYLVLATVMCIEICEHSGA